MTISGRKIKVFLTKYFLEGASQENSEENFPPPPPPVDPLNAWE